MKAETVKPLPKIMIGTVHVQFVRCGKSNCRCARGQLHGPYHYHFLRDGRRTRKRYLRRSEVEDVRLACLNRQEMRSRRIRQSKAAWSLLRRLREQLRSFSDLV